MSVASGTYRGTPGRGHGRGQLPGFENSPSAIPVPRPKLETQPSSNMPSEAGTSTMSASRQKQSKRDEVCLENYGVGNCVLISRCIGNTKENGG